MVTTIIILATVLLLLLAYMCFVTHTDRAKMRTQMTKQLRQIDLASAGSDEDGCHLRKRSVEVSSVDTTLYTDGAGNVLNPDDYNLFIVDGNSMRLCGIYDKNLIFVTKTLNITEVNNFPIILVLNKKNVRDDRPAFKIRRTWAHISFSDDRAIMEVLSSILCSEPFQEIRNLAEYPGDDVIIEDFQKTRLVHYKAQYIDCENPNRADRDIIISSTLETSNNRIHFSIHPISRISGEVIASFDMSNDQFL
ncbi:MAG: hypothetical protein K2M63_02475 [Muribaculaceae bacterium]|nr:hypothetical protein [Muribaculaceae bacterium]